MEEPQKIAPPPVPIVFGKPPRRSARRFLAFLLCASLLLAAFAVSGLWLRRGDRDFWEKLGSFWRREEETVPPVDDADEVPPGTSPSNPSGDLNAGAAPPMPQGAVPILTKDLSSASSGVALHNETVYRPDPAVLRQDPTTGEMTFDPEKGPIVLILHTHAAEAYLSESASYITGSLGEVSYSVDPTRNVTAIGRVLCNVLNQNGVPALHCGELHGESGTLQQSYAHAADCIRDYLQRYPTIRYVIDVHRDGLLTSNGEYVRTLAQGCEKPTAQVMAVVGSDCNGTTHSMWQSNLSLAIRLGDRLGSINQTIYRPVSLRNASYNQELVPGALLLEIGSGGNTVDEAMRAAEAVGKCLSDLICNR